MGIEFWGMTLSEHYQTGCPKTKTIEIDLIGFNLFGALLCFEQVFPKVFGLKCSEAILPCINILKTRKSVPAAALGSDQSINI